MAPHEVLRESLRGFQLRGGRAGAENFQSRRLERIGDPEGERVIRPDHREPDVPGFREVGEPGNVVRSERDIFAQLRGARISGRAENFVDPWRPGEFPRERVLAAAGADDEDVHDPKRSVVVWSGSAGRESSTERPSTLRTLP